MGNNTPEKAVYFALNIFPGHPKLFWACHLILGPDLQIKQTNVFTWNKWQRMHKTCRWLWWAPFQMLLPEKIVNLNLVVWSSYNKQTKKWTMNQFWKRVYKVFSWLYKTCETFMITVWNAALGNNQTNKQIGAWHSERAINLHMNLQVTLWNVGDFSECSLKGWCCLKMCAT